MSPVLWLETTRFNQISISETASSDISAKRLLSIAKKKVDLCLENAPFLPERSFSPVFQLHRLAARDFESNFQLVNIWNSVWSVWLRSVRKPAVASQSWQDKYQQAGRGKNDSSPATSQSMSSESLASCSCRWCAWADLCEHLCTSMWRTCCSLMARTCLPNIWPHLSVWTFTQYTQVKTTTAK